MNINKFRIEAPYGVTYNINVDGSLMVSFTMNLAPMLRDKLKEAAKTINDIMIADMERLRAEEIARQRMPVSSLQNIDARLAALRGDEVNAMAPAHEIPATVVAGGSD